MDWLNENSGAVNGLLTLVLASATLAYVVLTYRLARQNAEILEFTVRPILSITMVPYEGDISIVNLLVENWGNGPALQVKFDIKQPIVREGLTALVDVGIFKKGLAHLGPHQRIQLFLAGTVGNLTALKEAPIEINAAYRDERGNEWGQRFVLNFAELEGLTSVGEPPLFTIAKVAEEVKASLAKLFVGTHKIPIVAYSLEDLKREGKITQLHLKLSQLEPADWAALERFADEKLKDRSGPEAPAP